MKPRLSEIMIEGVKGYQVEVTEGDQVLFPVIASTNRAVAQTYYDSVLQALKEYYVEEIEMLRVGPSVD